MQKRLLLLAGCYMAFYHLIHLVYDMPNLVHGSPQFAFFPHWLRGWVLRIYDLAFYFLFVLIPYWVMAVWYPQKKILQSVLMIGFVLTLLFLLPALWERGGLTGLSRVMRLRTYFLNNLSYAIVFLVFGIGFFFVRYAYYKELQQKDLEIQQRRSELSFLRSQVNPHFLFNSLNNIYSLVYQGSGKALTAIAGLSDLLRYMLYDATEKVPLEKEMEYIQKYIGLQTLRYDHPIEASVRVEGSLAGVGIPPLLLIPFVENAFKHGDLRADGGGLAVVLRSGADKIFFHCVNRKGAGKQEKDPGGGIGLENVRRRLALLYPGRHTLTIENGPVHFSINLELIHE